MKRMCDFYIFGHSDYIKYSLEDILKLPNVHYYDFGKANSIFMRLMLSQWFPGIFKKIMLRLLPQTIMGFDIEKKAEQVMIFIIYERNRLSINKYFLDYLKQKNPTAKFCFMLTNLISDSWLESNKKILDFLLHKKYYNWVLTFNKFDADKYGFVYYEFVNSRHNFTTEKKEEFEFDVFFCGRDKGRAKQIEEAFLHLSSLGLRCNFNIIVDDTSPDEMVAGIKYFKYMIPNIKVLEDMSHCKCILDIVFDKAAPGQSLRFSEAIAYEKVLITNNRFTLENPLYNPDQMIVFSDISEIRLEDIEEKVQTHNFRSSNTVSPCKLLTFLEQKFDASR